MARTHFGILLLLIGMTHFASAAERVVQYRGDRNGHYADAKPSALSWDLAKGTNIRWTAATPNWGYGHPLVVGNQLIVVDEPGWEHDFPVISAYDLTTGKQLWLTEINHLPALEIDQEEQKQVESILHEVWANFRKAYTYSHRGYQRKLTPEEESETWTWLQSIDPERWKLTGHEKKDPRVKGSFATFFAGKQKKGYGGLRAWKFSWVGLAKYPEMKKVFGSKYGLASEGFYGFNEAREGVAAPAPLSDGKHIYWGGLWGSRVCLNLDGSIKWLVWNKHPKKNGAQGYGHVDSIYRSPILWNGLLIFDNFNQTEAYDCETGKLTWICDTWQGAVNGPPAHSGGSSAASSHIMEVGGQHFLLNNHGAIVHLETGKLAMHNFHELQTKPNAPNSGFGHLEMATIDEHDIVMRVSPGGRPKTYFGNKLSWDGSTLSMKEIWSFTIAERSELAGLKKPGWGSSAAVLGTKVYVKNFAIDSLTGSVKQTKVGSTRWLRATNGTHVFGLNTSGAMSIYDIASGTTLSPQPKFAKGEKYTRRSQAMIDAMVERHIATFGKHPKDMSMSYSSPFLLVDDAIIMRSASHLICVGK